MKAVLLQLAFRRPKMVPAALPLSCWNVMDLASVSKVALRVISRYGPTLEMISAKIGSALLRCSNATSIEGPRGALRPRRS